MKRKLAPVAVALLVAGWHLGCAAAEYVNLPGGTYRSVTAGDVTKGLSSVAPFSMRALPVTRGEFARFVRENPGWQRAKVPKVFADAGYLASLPAAVAPDDATPVTQVSWFAAQAYCESEGARLPTWNEWEFAAAADETRTDARDDPLWRAQILAWYARPANTAIPGVGGTPNVYGISNLHGLIWEWTDDFNSLLVNEDSRSGDDPDKLKFCGAGAINLQQRENYAVLMRVALLSSLKASNSTGSLGFRCVKPSQ